MAGQVKIGIVISHPIQHFCPQFVSFAKNDQVHCKVFFASALGFKKYADVNFKKEISWSNLNLDEFEHVFLNGDAVIQPDKDLDAASLENELNLFKPHLIFTYGYFQKFQRRAHRWALQHNVSIAYISDSELRHKRNSLKEFLKSIYLRHYFSKANYFLSMGNANEEYYLKHGVDRHKILRMHYPIDREQYIESYGQREFLRNNIRERFSLTPKDIVLSVVGKLVQWKNQGHIIEAMKQLENEGVYLHLFILGSGELEQDLKTKSTSLIHGKVYFPGFVNIDELPAFYAATDIYVHPASMEPHSVAISEAIAMGCPVVLSDRCGSYGEDDDVQVGRNGYTYPFGNIPELASTLKKLATNEDLRIRFGQYSHNLSLAFQRNSHHTILDKILRSMRFEEEKK